MAPSGYELPPPGGPGDVPPVRPWRDYAVDYRVIQEIGRGGQGIVYLAEDRARGRKVAIKVLRDVGGISDEALARLRREVDAAARLDHPGICNVIEAVLDGPNPWIAMRYVEGRSLAQEIAAAQGLSDETLIARPGAPSDSTPITPALPPNARPPSGPSTPADVDRLLEVIEGAARALHAAHERGVVHRDVKPSNIMVGPDRRPVILDFGLAHLDETDVAGLTRTGEIWGTPAYLSPEQLVPKARIDRRTDVWSLGVTLYECLTLRRPFEGPTNNHVFHAIQSKDPPDPTKLNRFLHHDLRIVLETALEKDRARRYDTALAFAEDLKCVRERRAIAARPIGPATRFVRWARRNPALAASLLVAFGALTIGLVVTVGLLIARDNALRERGFALSQKDRALFEKDRALEHSEGLRLLAESSAALARDPGLALLLAIEGARRAPQAAALVNGTVNEALSELREARTLVGHVAQIEAAEFSPDGRSAVTLASDGEVRVWDLATGATVGAFLHARAVRAAFTPGGGRVVSLAADGTARVWRPGSGSPVVVEDVGAHAMSGDARLLLTLGPAEARIWVADTGDTVATVPVATSVLDWIGFSPDGGRVLAIERDGTATAWTTDTGALVARAERAFPDVRLPLFSPDGRAVVALAGAAASVWNVDTASMTALDGAPHDLLSLSFSPDGTRILGLSNDSVIVWDARTGRSRVLCGPDPGDATRADGPRPEASFTQDSQRIVGASCDGTGHVWNADTGEELSILSGHAGDVRFVSASPDGSTVVTSSSGGMMTLWDAATWTQLAVLRGHSGDVRHVRFSPSGDRIVSASTDRTARVWNAVMAFGAPLLEGHQGAVTEVRFDARGQLALTASADGYPRLWDVRTSRLLARLVAKKGLAAPEFSPDGTRAVALCEDGTAVLFDVPGGTPVATLGGESSLCSASAFSPDGSRLVTGSDDGTAHVFDTRDGRHLTRLAGHEGAIHFVGYCAGGARIVTASDDHTARIWDATTGDAIAQTPGHGHEPPIVGPDGSRIVVTLAHGEIRVYDARTGNEVVRLPGRGHAAPTYSADGLRLATEDADGYVRLWDPETAREAGAVRPEEGSRLRAFSPDGTRILTTTRDGAAHLWDAQRGRRVGVVQGSGGPVIDAGFSPDGRWVVLSSFEDTRILDAASAREAWVMTRRHGSVKTVRFSPDGAWLLAGYAGGVARLWPADPLVKARALTPRALTLHEIQKHGVAAPGVVAGVLRIFDDALTNEEIVEIVERRTDLDDPLRQAAIKAALTRDPGVVGEKLRRRAWSVAVRPNGAPEQYASALRWIEVALKLNPSAEDGIATLGAAQFRAGLHHKALATLEGALRKIPASPRSYARVRIALFIAMAHAKLGQPREASTALSDARRTLRELGPSPPEEIRRLLDEATRLIVPEKPPERQ